MYLFVGAAGREDKTISARRGLCSPEYIKTWIEGTQHESNGMYLSTTVKPAWDDPLRKDCPMWENHFAITQNIFLP